MLYVTTRNNRDAYTAQRALREKRAPDGGLYLPLQMPTYSLEEINALEKNTFGENMAGALNRLLGTQLSGWDMDFCIGRYPVKLESMRQKTLLAETWHNPQWDYERLVNNLVSHLCDESTAPGNWARIAIRIAVLFGIFGELKRQGIETADISVVSSDFSAPISAWYARQMGLPINNIVCCCNENNSLWDLICQGLLRTDDLSIPTITPESDVVIPVNLERLIYACGGVEETEAYLRCCREGNTYYPGDTVLTKLRSGLFVSVVSSNRLESTIPGFFRTNGYLLSPYSAMAYSGLMDYRYKTGATGHAFVLSERSPHVDAEAISGITGMQTEEIDNILAGS